MSILHSDRRGFLRNLVGGLAATAAVRTWPFRVYSFPTDIVIPRPISYSLDGGITWTTSSSSSINVIAMVDDLRERVIIDRVNLFEYPPRITVRVNA